MCICPVRRAQAIRQLIDHLGVPVPAAIVTGDISPERLREARASSHRLLHKPVAAEQLRELTEQSALAARARDSPRSNGSPLERSDPLSARRSRCAQ